MNEILDKSGLEAPSGIDLLEAAMVEAMERGEAVPVDMPITHRLTPGLYIREIFIPAGTKLTSMRHRHEHPFVISQGEIQVMSESEGVATYRAPYCGITEAGTRRVLQSVTDTIWTTFHVTDKTDIEEILDDIVFPSNNPLIPKDHPLVNVYQNSTPKLENKP